MSKEILIRGHLGLGDAMVCNALVREYAREKQVTWLCKKKNQASLAFMWRDEPSIALVTTDGTQLGDDEFANRAVRFCRDRGKKTLSLGMFGDKNAYDHNQWDISIYKQAGLDFWNTRWLKFRCERNPSKEIQAPKGKFAFVHEDPERGFVIPKKRLPRGLKLFRPDPTRSDNIFDWWHVLEEATQIHVIDSSFAILVDSLPDLRAVRLVLHLYARPGALPPNYGKDWEILSR